MRLSTILFIVTFLAGYVANDVIHALGIGLVKPALAQNAAFESAVRSIVASCEVYVYEINGNEGVGEIIC